MTSEVLTPEKAIEKASVFNMGYLIWVNPTVVGQKQLLSVNLSDDVKKSARKPNNSANL